MSISRGSVLPTCPDSSPVFLNSLSAPFCSTNKLKFHQETISEAPHYSVSPKFTHSMCVYLYVHKRDGEEFSKAVIHPVCYVEKINSTKRKNNPFRQLLTLQKLQSYKTWANRCSGIQLARSFSHSAMEVLPFNLGFRKIKV